MFLLISCPTFDAGKRTSNLKNNIFVHKESVTCLDQESRAFVDSIILIGNYIKEDWQLSKASWLAK